MLDIAALGTIFNISSMKHCESDFSYDMIILVSGTSVVTWYKGDQVLTAKDFIVLQVKNLLKISNIKTIQSFPECLKITLFLNYNFEICHSIIFDMGL